MIKLPAYTKLQQHFANLSQLSIKELFIQDATRAKEFFYHVGSMSFDLSKNNITQETVKLLVELAKESNLAQNIDAMFSGQKINITENRAVLHTALRANIDPSKDKLNIDPNQDKLNLDGHNVYEDITHVLSQMKQFTNQVYLGKICGCSGKQYTDIVNIGIGGSDLGAKLITHALKPYRSLNVKIHFVSSVDGYELLDVLNQLDPETTLFIIASKTFTTQETMTNANSAKQWFLQSGKSQKDIAKHFVALSTNLEKVQEFGIAPNNIFAFWDFVGGRFSCCSAIGLSIMLYIGVENFRSLLAGANYMDQHFHNTHDFSKNLPVLLALISIWYINFYNYPSLVISTYNSQLNYFAAYIQQLVMESNGKSVDIDGNPISYKTSPIVWGGNGINGQHAYFQLLHQGTTIHPMDIIIALSNKSSKKNHQDILVANAFAQAQAFMEGQSYNQILQQLIAKGVEQPIASFLAKHKIFSANRPTNMIMLEEVSPYTLGMLIALYEHKTMVEGIIWRINSFDQMGVELGKVLANKILDNINHNSSGNNDSSTKQLIETYLT